MSIPTTELRWAASLDPTDRPKDRRERRAPQHRSQTSRPGRLFGLVAVLFDSSKAILVRHPHRGSFVHECTTRDDCENLVQRPLRAHHAKMRANSTSARGSTLKACRDADAKLVELGDDLNASARADAIIDACSNAPRHAWSRADARFVLDRSWLPIRRCRTHRNTMAPERAMVARRSASRAIC